jgi:hypothetical protein
VNDVAVHIDEIADIARDSTSEAVEVNRRITGTYHRLSEAARRELHEDADLDWCGFAKWSSHTVGLDLDPRMPGTRIQELATLTGLPDQLQDHLTQLLTEGRNVEDQLALKALRAGNAVIFFEMGSIFAHLLERLPERRQPTSTSESDAEFAHEVVETVTDARRRRFPEPLGPDVLESPSASESLEPAIVFYLRAAREPDHQAELLLAGSMLFSVYEQTRADRLITIGTCAPVRAAFARLLTDLALVVEVADEQRVRLGHPELLEPGVTATLSESGTSWSR